MENKLTPLQQAVLDSVLAEYAHVPEETQIEYTFSQKFEKWARKLIAETDRLTKHRLSKTVKLIIIVAAIIALLAACAVAIPAIREGLVDFFLTEKIDHYCVTFDPAQAAYAPDEIEEYIVPSYVPEGYSVIADDRSPAGVIQAWTNEQGRIITYNQCFIPKDATQDNWMGISSEGVSRSSAVTYGYKVEIVEDTDVSTMVWTDNQYLYFVSVPNELPFSEFEKMLSSMMFVGTGAYGITFDPDMAANAPHQIEEQIIPSYIPEDFESVLDERSILGTDLAWVNDKEEWIIYSQMRIPEDVEDDNWLRISVEDTTRRSVVVNGYKVEILGYVDENMMIWTDNRYLYYLVMPHTLPFEEFEKMLNSMMVVGTEAYGITFDPDQAASAPHEILEYHIPQYAPDGYTICAEDKTPAIVTVIWNNDAGNVIVYNQNFIPDNSTNDNWIGINAEDVIRSSAIISGYKVEIITEQDVYTAVWTDNMYLYMITLPNSLDLTVFEQILNSITVIS